MRFSWRSDRARTSAEKRSRRPWRAETIDPADINIDTNIDINMNINMNTGIYKYTFCYIIIFLFFYELAEIDRDF